jgi:hypothetical protein
MSSDEEDNVEMTQVNPMQEKRRSSMADYTFNVHTIEKTLKAGAINGQLTDKQQHTINNLKKMDKDGDGEISLIEILALEEDLDAEKRKGDRLKKILCGVVIGILFCLASIMCMGIAAVEITKETRVRGGNPVSKSTGSVPITPKSTRRRRLGSRNLQDLGIPAKPEDYLPAEKTDIENAKKAAGIYVPTSGDSTAPYTPGMGGIATPPPTADGDGETSVDARAKVKEEEEMNADFLEKDLTGTEKVLKAAEEYNKIVDSLVEEIQKRFLAGDNSYDKKELAEAVKGFENIHACVFNDGGTIVSFPASECPTIADPATGKQVIDRPALFSKVGTEIPIDLHANHVAYLLDNCGGTLTCAKQIVGSVPSIVNGADRKITLSNGMGDKQLATVKKVVLSNKVTGETKEFDASVTNRAQEAGGVAGTLEITIPSETPGEKDGKMIITGNGDMVITNEVHDSITKDSMAPGMKLPDGTVAPKVSKLDKDTFSISAVSTMSTSGASDDAAVQEAFPDMECDPTQNKCAVAVPAASPNTPDPETAGTIIKEDLIYCKEGECGPNTELRICGEEIDPITETLETKYCHYEKSTTETSTATVDTVHGPQKMQIKHTVGPNTIKPGEPAGPGATEIRQETTTYVSEHVTMTKTKETFDPTTEPPSNLPDGATGAYHDGSYTYGVEGTDTQVDCHTDVQIKSTDQGVLHDPEPMLSSMGMSIEIPTETVAKRRLAQLDRGARTHGNTFARAHHHARALVAALGGNADIYENNDPESECHMVVEHCGARSEGEKEDLESLKKEASELGSGVKDAVARRRLSPRQLATHVHGRKLALYTSQLSIRVPRSHRRLSHHARQMTHKLNHISHKHEKFTGRRLSISSQAGVNILTDVDLSNFIKNNAPKDVKDEYENAIVHMSTLDEEITKMMELFKDIDDEKREIANKPASQPTAADMTKLEDLNKKDAAVESGLSHMRDLKRSAEKVKHEIEEVARTFKAAYEHKKTAIGNLASLTATVDAKKLELMKITKDEFKKVNPRPSVNSYFDPVSKQQYDFEDPSKTPSVKNPAAFFADFESAKEFDAVKKNLEKNLAIIQEADALLANIDEPQSKCMMTCLPHVAPGSVAHTQHEIKTQLHKDDDKQFDTLVGSEIVDLLFDSGGEPKTEDDLHAHHKPNCLPSHNIPTDGTEPPMHVRRMLEADDSYSTEEHRKAIRRVLQSYVEEDCDSLKESLRSACKQRNRDAQAKAKALKSAARKVPQTGNFASTASTAAVELAEESHEMVKELSQLATNHKECASAIKTKACDCTNVPDANTDAECQYRCAEKEKIEAAVRDLGHEVAMSRIEAPATVSADHPAMVVPITTAHIENATAKAKETMMKIANQSSHCPGLSRRRRLTTTPDPCTKPQTAQKQMDDLHDIGIRTAAPVNPSSVPTYTDASGQKKTHTNPAPVVPPEKPNRPKLNMCSNISTIDENCTAIVHIDPSAHMPYEAEVHTVGDDSRDFCMHHGPEEEPCCSMTGRDEQLSCLHEKRYCYNHSPEDNACCKKIDFKAQDDCLERQGTNPINDDRGETRKMAPKNEEPRPDPVGKMTWKVPMESGDNDWNDISPTMQVRAQVIDASPARVASTDGKLDKVEGHITVEATGDGVMVSTNMKVYFRAKMNPDHLEELADACMRHGGNIMECCAKSEWNEREQKEACVFPEKIEVPPVEAFFGAKFDAVGKHVVIQVRAHADGYKFAPDNVLVFGMEAGLDYVPDTGSMSDMKSRIWVALDKGRANKEMQYDPMEHIPRDFKTEERNDDPCERASPDGCEAEPTGQCKEMCDCDNAAGRCKSKRHPDERPGTMDEERPRGPPNCGTGFFCITDAVEKGQSEPKCVDSCSDCGDRAEGHACNPENPAQCMSVCYTPSTNTCPFMGMVYCSSSKSCVGDCSRCTGVNHMIADTRQNKCVKSAPDTCEARGLLFCEANGDCVEPNEAGLNACERGSEAAKPKEATQKPREESRPTKTKKIIEQERAEHEMREKPTDPKEAAMTRSEMYIANASQVRDNGIIDQDGVKKENDNAYVSPAVMPVTVDICQKKGDVLCEYRGNVRCLDNCGKCPHKNASYEGTCMKPREVPVTSVHKFFCPENGDLVDTDCSSCGTYTIENYVHQVCEQDETVASKPGDWCEIDFGGEKIARFVDNCFTDCRIENSPIGPIRKEANISGVCKFVTEAMCKKAGLFWCPNDSNNEVSGEMEGGGFLAVSVTTTITNGKNFTSTDPAPYKAGELITVTNVPGKQCAATGTYTVNSVNTNVVHVTETISSQVGGDNCEIYRKNSTYKYTRIGQCVQNCRDQCVKIEFDKNAMRLDELNAMAQNPNVGMDALTITHLPANESGVCKAEADAATSCDNIGQYYCPLLDTCVSQCWDCSKEGENYGWEYWSVNGKTENDKKVCEKPCENYGAFCPTTQQCLKDNSHYNEQTYEWFEDTSCADECGVFTEAAWNEKSNRRVCGEPSAKICMNAGKVYCPSTRKCLEHNLGPKRCEVGCKLEKFDPAWSDEPSKFECKATEREVAAVCKENEYFCKEDYGSYCTSSCEWCYMNGNPSVAMNQSGVNVCSAKYQEPPTYETAVEYPIYNTDNGTHHEDSEHYVEQVVYLPGDNSRPLEEQKNMTITVPNYNMTIPTETRMETQHMFWCPSTSMYVTECYMDCKDYREVDGAGNCAANVKVYGCTNPDATNFDKEATSLMTGEDCDDWMSYPEKCWSCTFKSKTAVLTNMTHYKMSHGINVSHEDTANATLTEMYNQMM